MKRILMLLMAVALMVALAAGPVFGGGNCNVSSQGEQCQGGSGSGGVGAEGIPGYVLGGGGGMHDRYDGETYVVSGGSGIGGSVVQGGGGGGGYCTSDLSSNPPDCVGGSGQGGATEF